MDIAQKGGSSQQCCQFCWARHSTSVESMISNGQCINPLPTLRAPAIVNSDPQAADRTYEFLS